MSTAIKIAYLNPQFNQEDPLKVFTRDYFIKRAPSSFFLVVCKNEGLVTQRLLEHLQDTLGIPLPAAETSGLEHSRPIRVLSMSQSNDSIVSKSTTPGCIATICIGGRRRRSLELATLIERGKIPKEYVSFIRPNVFMKNPSVFESRVRNYLKAMREFVKDQDSWG